MEGLTKSENIKHLTGSERDPCQLKLNDLSFISMGVGCHCLVALESLELVEVLLTEGFFVS